MLHPANLSSQQTPGGQSDPKHYERREDADVQGRLRQWRIREHRSQSEATDNKSNGDQDHQCEEQISHKGSHQDASQINIPWCAHWISLKQAFQPIEEAPVAPGLRHSVSADNRDAAAHSCNERYVRRDLFDPDSHRNSLCKPNPSEDRVHVWKTLCAARRVRSADAARDALDPSADRSLETQQRRLHGIADMNV